jgi:hypothetical protein
MVETLIAGAVAGSWPAALVLCVGAIACAAAAIAPFWALSKGM